MGISIDNDNLKYFNQKFNVKFIYNLNLMNQHNYVFDERVYNPFFFVFFLSGG